MLSFVSLLNECPKIGVYNYHDFARYYIGDVPNDMTTEVMPVSIQLEWENLLCLSNQFSLGPTVLDSFIKRKINNDLISLLKAANNHNDLLAVTEAIENIQIEINASKLDFSTKAHAGSDSYYKNQPEENLTLASKIWKEEDNTAQDLCIGKIELLEKSVALEIRHAYTLELDEIKASRFYQMLEETLLEKDMETLHSANSQAVRKASKKNEYFFYRAKGRSNEDWNEFINDLWSFLTHKKFIDTDRHDKTDFNTLFSEHSNNHKTITWESDRQSLGVLGKHLPLIVEPQKQKMKIISERFRLSDDLKLTAEKLSQAAKGDAASYKQNGTTIWNFLNDLS